MKKITSIQPQEDNPNLRAIFVNDQHVATLTSNAINLLELTIGAEWNKTISSAVFQHNENEQGRKIALKLISKRMWGTDELLNRLIDRGVKIDAAKQVIQSLITDDWLDDEQYAEALIREWTRKEPAGKLLLIKKLRHKQLNEETINKTLSKYFEEYPQHKAATKFAAIRLQKNKNPLDKETKNKLISAMYRRGFTSEESHDALRKAIEQLSS